MLRSRSNLCGKLVTKQNRCLSRHRSCLFTAALTKLVKCSIFLMFLYYIFEFIVVVNSKTLLEEENFIICCYFQILAGINYDVFVFRKQESLLVVDNLYDYV